MSQYLMRLTPREPYFFGNDKTFTYPGNEEKNVSRYYIKSELTPSQSTLIGTLRYVLLPIKKAYAEYSSEDIAINNSVVGEYSFRYGAENSFGCIKKVSPLFLTQGNDRFVVTPFDHNQTSNTYTPFNEYVELNGFSYPKNYNAKKGIQNSYMRVGDGAIYKNSDLFSFSMRVGINRKDTSDGFFKKNYVALKSGFSFASFVTLSDEVTPKDTVAFLGQGKSLFSVTFDKVEDKEDELFEKSIGNMLKANIVYCFSDTFMPSSNYKNSLFSITQLRDYRIYTTKYGKKNDRYYQSITKDSFLYKTIKAGSVFIPRNEVFSDAVTDPSVQIIGFNVLLKRTEDE